MQFWKLARVSVACLGLALVGVTAIAAPLDKVKAAGVLNVALYKDFPPYSYVKDGKQEGIDVEIAQALAEKLGVTSAIRMITPDETAGDDLRNNIWKGHYLGGGVADVMLHAPYDREYAEREDMVSFIAPYQLDKVTFAVNTEKLGDQPTLASLVNAKVGVEVDTLSDFYLIRALDGKITDKVQHFKSITEAVAALKDGKVDAIMAPRGELEGIMAQASAPANLAIREMITPGLSRTSWAVGAAVKAPFKDLSEAVEKAMGELITEGKVKDIFAKYKVSYIAPALPPIVLNKKKD